MKQLRLSGWKSESGRREYLEAYEAALELWPVSYESVEIETRFGATHAVASGPVDGAALLLLPAAIGIGALQWYPNAGRLSDDHRIYALDFVGAPGTGTQTAPMIDRHDYAAWLVDVLDGLGLERARFVGSSQGGWFVLNLCVMESERVEAAAVLAPAASLSPFKLAAIISLKMPPAPGWAARPALQMFLGPEIDDRLVRLMAAGLRHFRYQQRAVYPDVFGDTALSRVHAPVLVMIGTKEIIYEPQGALERANRLIANVETELVPGASHVPNMQMPDLVDNRLVRFFSEAPATA